MCSDLNARRSLQNIMVDSWKEIWKYPSAYYSENLSGGPFSRQLEGWIHVFEGEYRSRPGIWVCLGWEIWSNLISKGIQCLWSWNGRSKIFFTCWCDNSSSFSWYCFGVWINIIWSRSMWKIIWNKFSFNFCQMMNDFEYCIKCAKKYWFLWIFVKLGKKCNFFIFWVEFLFWFFKHISKIKL